MIQFIVATTKSMWHYSNQVKQSSHHVWLCVSIMFSCAAFLSRVFYGAPGMARSALALFDSLWW